MPKKLRFFRLAVLLFSLWMVPRLGAQQTLGGITGTVLDDSGAAIPAATVTIVGNETKLTRSQDTNEAGNYDFVNLPIGSYSISVSHSGFQALQIPAIQVQANRTAHCERHPENWRCPRDHHGGRDPARQCRRRHQHLRS